MSSTLSWPKRLNEKLKGSPFAKLYCSEVYSYSMLFKINKLSLSSKGKTVPFFVCTLKS